MTFIARKSAEVSSAGQVPAVVADYRELGMRHVDFPDGQSVDREEVAFIYVTAQFDARKQPIVVTQSFNKSLDERSNLFAAISGILGGTMPDDGIDPVALIGKQVTLTVEVVTTLAGTSFAKVTAVAPAPAEQKIPIPATFRRQQSELGRRR
jgi:hypothetical protein